MNTPDPLSDRRHRRRHQLAEEILVVDQLRNESVGRLVNLHQEGLMLVGREIPKNAPLQVILVLPNSINQQENIVIGIECLWSQRADLQEPLYWSGCSIIDKSSLAEMCIEKLVSIQC